MHVVTDKEPSLKDTVNQFVDRSVDSRMLAVAGRWFSVLTPPLFCLALGWIISTLISTDKDLGVVTSKVVAIEGRLLSAEDNLGNLKDFIAQSRVAREKDLGELKQRISIVETQQKVLLDSAGRQEDKLDKIFDRLSGTVVR